ncbi:PREDICTED: signal peptidase complex catalytic subunit SEC11A-like [Populus euphratica]|uniref:signal peptidase I n=1 Tax=Populus euphratica TaxID=75702 RepID=A0AAJ6XUM9_POPEU|nr:PREDICTED: signal peptidase complex catalytic subunit SEC11A-like [Populus euphratica]
MERIANNVESIKSMKIRDTLTQFITLGIIASTVLIIWKVLMCLTGSESPVVVVLSGSMEPGFKRGDILFLHMSKAPVRIGEIVVYSVEGRPVPIVHRVIEVHEEENNGNVDILTKGDANPLDDRSFYANSQHWLKSQQIIGRDVAFVPYAGWATIIMTEKPIIKYMFIGVLGLLVITSKD